MPQDPIVRTVPIRRPLLRRRFDAESPSTPRTRTPRRLAPHGEPTDLRPPVPASVPVTAESEPVPTMSLAEFTHAAVQLVSGHPAERANDVPVYAVLPNGTRVSIASLEVGDPE